MEVSGKRVLVFGSGISGIGAAELLEKHGAQVVLYDGNDKLKKEDVEGKLSESSEAEIVIGDFPAELLDVLDLAILSPGVPLDLPVVAAMREPFWLKVTKGLLFSSLSSFMPCLALP